MKSLSFLFYFFLTAFLLQPLHVIADDLNISTPSLTGDSSNWLWTPSGTMTGTELGAMIETEIGAGNYYLVTVMLHTCHSGAGVDNVAAELSGDHIVIAATGAKATSHISSGYGFGNGFFDSLSQNSGNTVAQHFTQGQAHVVRNRNLAISPEVAMQMLYERERKRKGLIDVLPSWGDGGKEIWIQQAENNASDPSFLGMPLGGEALSNHAIIYRTMDNDLSVTEAETIKSALANMNFNTTDELTPATKAEKTALKAATSYPTIRDDMATPQNLRAKLQALKPSMNNMEHLLVVIIAHGSQIDYSQRSTTAGGLRRAIQLRSIRELFSSTNNLDYISSYEDIRLLLSEEVSDGQGGVLSDWTTFSRWSQPVLTIQTFSETNPSGQDVEVYVNDVKLGTMDLDSNNTGFHQLEFSDDVIRTIVQSTDISSGLTLRFKFADSSDSFELAEQADIALQDGANGYSGISISYGLDGDSYENHAYLPALYYLLLH